MSDPGYWTTKHMSRRTLLRGTAIGSMGLAGAALIGCGGSGDSTSATSGGSTAVAGSTPAAGSGVPANVVRAVGYDAKLGTSPINDRPVELGGTFRMTYTQTPREQDPDIVIGTSSHALMNDRLFYVNGWTMKLNPDMAASYEVKDPMDIRVTLRPGIKLFDRAPGSGRTFTAEDVAFSINRKAGIVDPKAAEKYARRAQFVGLERAIAIDERTVQLKMKSPNGSIFNALADPRATMIPKESDSIGYKDTLKFIGTGAWIQTEFVEGTREVFEANPKYYRSWDEGGRPGLARHERIVVADRGSQVAAFVTGQSDAMYGVLPVEETQIRASVPDAQWFTHPHIDWKHFAMNLKNPIFQDDRVRQAVQRSIDIKNLADPTGTGWIYVGPLYPLFPEAQSPDEVKKLPGYNPETKQQDIQEAVKLMSAAGKPEGEGMKFKLWLAQTAGLEFDVAVRLKNQWAKIFPKMDMALTSAPDSASFNAALNAKEFDARIYGHTSVPDAAVDVRTYYHTGGGRNYQSFSKPWADEAIDKMQTALTMEDRKAAIKPFLERYTKEGPAMYTMFTPQTRDVYSANLAGMDLISGSWGYSTYGPTTRWFWRTKKK